MPWIEESSQTNTRKGRLNPLPLGPYIYINQHDENTWLNMDYDDVRRKVFEIVSLDFEYRLGFAVYIGDNQKVAYYYDCSD